MVMEGHKHPKIVNFFKSSHQSEPERLKEQEKVEKLCRPSAPPKVTFWRRESETTSNY